MNYSKKLRVEMYTTFKKGLTRRGGGESSSPVSDPSSSDPLFSSSKHEPEFMECRRQVECKLWLQTSGEIRKDLMFTFSSVMPL